MIDTEKRKLARDEAINHAIALQNVPVDLIPMFRSFGAMVFSDGATYGIEALAELKKRTMEGVK